MKAPVLVIGIGNPSRGDDALGPLAIEHLAALDLPGVELLTDFQLQIEHALDIQDRHEVVFIDAAVGIPGPYVFRPVRPRRDVEAHTTHALAPEAVLGACERIGGVLPNSAFVLAIRGENFELGAPASAAALDHLSRALAMLEQRYAATPP